MRAAWVLLTALAALSAYYIYLPLPGTVSDPWKLMLLDATFRAVQQTVRRLWRGGQTPHRPPPVGSVRAEAPAQPSRGRRGTRPAAQGGSCRHQGRPRPPLGPVSAVAGCYRIPEEAEGERGSGAGLCWPGGERRRAGSARAARGFLLIRESERASSIVELVARLRFWVSRCRSY